jgi:hypothetical protein
MNSGKSDGNKDDYFDLRSDSCPMDIGIAIYLDQDLSLAKSDGIPHALHALLSQNA